MKKKSIFYNLSYLICTLLLFAACTKEPNNMQVSTGKSYENIDSELWIYFHNFEIEAGKRGITVDFTNEDIVALIEAFDLARPVGVCIYGIHEPNEVIIDAPFWQRASRLRKELIVFHELGHCYLQRPHNEDTHSNGSCASIMRSGIEGCVDNYNSRTRDDYLDELFLEH